MTEERDGIPDPAHRTGLDRSPHAPPAGFPFPPEAFCRHCQNRIVGSAPTPCPGRADESPCESAPGETVATGGRL